MRRTVNALFVALVALLAALALCHAPAPTQAAVMGVDFGSEFIKVASVKPGTPFHIVVDEQSKRKVPAVVAFDHGERHFGNGAVQLALRKPKDAYMWALRLLGKDIDSPQVAALKAQGYAWDIVSLPERGGSLGFRHASGVSGQEDVIFSVEEVVAMSLQHVMKIAEADAESPVKDCVLTVPDYWTHRERQAMLDAAELAGLNVLSLLNENTAAAIQYGIDRKYNLTDAPHTILLYNMGSTSTKVTLASYSAYLSKGGRGAARGANRTVGQVDILGLGYDDTLGGQAFETRIADWIIDQVAAQQKAKNKPVFNVRSNARAMAKIRSAAEKAKVVLSANQEAQVFLASLVEDTDFKMMITREDFVGMVGDLLERVAKPITQALANAGGEAQGATLDKIDAVVIVGGSVRIPAVQSAIKSATSKDVLTQNLDGDEAMVMGAVFRAANQSTTFQVRPFGVVDATPYAVGVRITNQNQEEAATTTTQTDAAAEEAEASSDEEGAAGAPATASGSAATGVFSKRASLYKGRNRLGKKKTVQFSHLSDFVATLSHETPATASGALPLPVGIPLGLDVYNVSGLSRLSNEGAKYAHLIAEGQKPRVSLSFMLDHSGLTTLLKADATLEEMVKVLKPKAKAPAATKNETDTVNVTANADANATATATEGEVPTEGAEPAGTEEKKEDTPASENGEESKPAAESEDAAASEGAAAATPTDAAAATEAESEPEYIMKKKTHTITLRVNKLFSTSSVSAMNSTQKLLAKSTLEKLRRADDLKKEIAAAKNTLEAHIYATRAQMNEGDEAIETVSTQEQRDAVIDALAAAEDWLYEQGDDSATIFHDKLAALRKLSDPILFRRAELTALPNALNASKTLLNFVDKQVSDYPTSRPWVPESDLKKLSDAASDVREWLEEQEEAQSKLAKHDVPVLDSEAIYERLRPLHKQSDAALKLKKPVEKPKPKDKDAAGKNKTKAGGKKNKTAGTAAEEATGTATEEDIPQENDADKQQQQDEQTKTEQQQQQEQTSSQEEQAATGTETPAEDAASDVPPKDEL